MSGGSAASVVESAEEISVEDAFLELDGVKTEPEFDGVKMEKGAVKLIFPRHHPDGGQDQEWPWNICGDQFEAPEREQVLHQAHQGH